MWQMDARMCQCGCADEQNIRTWSDIFSIGISGINYLSFDTLTILQDSSGAGTCECDELKKRIQELEEQLKVSA